MSIFNHKKNCSETESPIPDDLSRARKLQRVVFTRVKGQKC